MVINQPSRHTLSADEVACQLQTSIQTGLNAAEAAQRLARFGKRLALTAESAERGVMRHPLRPPQESIFAHSMW